MQRRLRQLAVQLGGLDAAGFSTGTDTRRADVVAEPIVFELVVRGGTVMDGTGSAGFVADIGVSNDGKIAAVGSGIGKGAREVDARGMLVCPGFVDVHSHYDGQASWDDLLAPSIWHGVTTTIFGNCGVGFAPVRPGRAAEKYLLDLMEGVEDIPGAVLDEGIQWGTWQTFGQYLDHLEKIPRTMDVGCLVPHGCVRAYVMGDRGGDHFERPTESELQQMRAVVRGALEAGAFGVSTARTVKHFSADGRPTPGACYLGLSGTLSHTPAHCA